MTIKPPSRFRPAATLGCTLLSLAATLHAADVYWDGTGTLWSSAPAWSTDPSGVTPDPVLPPAAGDVAVFSMAGVTTAKTISLDADQAVDGLAFSSTGTTTLQGGGTNRTLTLGPAGITLHPGAAAVTVGSATAGQQVPLTLTSDQDWTNPTATALTIMNPVNGEGFNLKVTGNTNFRNNSPGAVINLGAGTLTFTTGNLDLSNNAHTMGGFHLRSGNVFVRNNSALGTTGTVTLGDPLITAGATIRGGSFTIARPLVLADGSTAPITLNNLGFGSPTFTGGITGTNHLFIDSIISGNGSACTLTVSTGSVDFSGNLTLRNGGTGTGASPGVAPTGTINISAPVSANVVNVRIQDLSTGYKSLQRVILGNTANAYAGTTTVDNNARLELGASQVIPHGVGTGAVTVNGTLILRTATGDSTETINSLSGTGTIDRTGASGTSTLIIGADDSSGTFNGIISNTAGRVALTKTGTGSLTLTGSSTYTGRTTVSNGSLMLAGFAQLADTGTLEITTGATVDLPAGGIEVISTLLFDGLPQATGRWGRPGSIAALGANFESALLTGDGLLDVTNTNADAYWDGTGTAWDSAASWSIDFLNPLANPPAPPSVDNITRFGGNGLVTPQTIQLNGNQGSSGMFFTSGVPFTFLGGNGDRTFTLGSGGISVAAEASAPLFGSTTAGQKVDLTLSAAQTWTNAAATGPITVSNALALGGTLTIAGSGGAVIEGIISGSAGLTKTGAGTLTLKGTNSHTGPTNMPGGSGIVSISSSTALGTGAVAITKAGTATGTLELNHGITAANNFTFNSATGFGAGGSAHIRNISGDNTLTGTLTLTVAGGNGINLESVSGLLTLANTISSTVADSARTMDFGGGGDGLVTGNIVNTGTNALAVRKTGSGTWTFSGSNTYTGTTSIDAGTLVLTKNNGLGNTSPVRIAGGATLKLDFAGTDTVGSVFIDGTNAGSGTFDASHPSGLFSGTGALLVVGVPDPFTPWIDTFSFPAGADKTRTGDPDGDGLSNLLEFAFDSDPSNGTAVGKSTTAVVDSYLTLTLPVRTGAVFTGTGPLLSAAVSKLIYQIEASNDLGTFTTGLEELIPAASAGLPALNTGWSYRSFRLVHMVTDAPASFLRTRVTATP